MPTRPGRRNHEEAGRHGVNLHAACEVAVDGKRRFPRRRPGGNLKVDLLLPVDVGHGEKRRRNPVESHRHIVEGGRKRD